MLRSLPLALVALGCTACAEAAPPTNSKSAIGYYTPGMNAPAHADLSRGDVPRDSYGRPFTYEGLGEKLPDFDGELASEQSFASSALAGQWTVIQVWGIWCHDSRNDAEYAAALSRAIGQDPDLNFMTIHTPQNANSTRKAFRGYSSVSAWFEEKGWSYPTLIDADASIREQLRIRWTPTYLVVAPDLTVQGFRTSLADAGDLAVKDFLQDVAETRRAWDSAQGL